MSKTPIAYIDISYFAHATEDEAKVLEATRNLLPTSQLENIDFKKSDVRGHHGNPIVLFEARIKEKNIVKAVAQNLASNLGPLDKETLLREIRLHVEKGSLYLRFDKQAAFRGTFKLGVADPIRVRLRFSKNEIDNIVQFCRELGMLP